MIFFLGSGFKTDTAISKSGDIKERELQPWKPDDNVPQPVWYGMNYLLFFSFIYTFY